MDGSTDARLHGCLTARMPGCTDDRLHGCQAARMPGCMDARLHGFQAARMPGCTDAWLHGCLAARMPVVPVTPFDVYFPANLNALDATPTVNMADPLLTLNGPLCSAGVMLIGFSS